MKSVGLGLEKKILFTSLVSTRPTYFSSSMLWSGWKTRTSNS